MNNLTRKDLIISGLCILSAALAVKFAVLVSNILIIAVLSLIFGTILNGPVSALCRRGLHRTLALFLCVIIFIGLVVGLMRIIVPQSVKEFSAIEKNMPQIKSKFEKTLLVPAKKININVNIESSFLEKKFKEYSPQIIHGVTKIGMNAVIVCVDIILVFLLTVYIAGDPKPLILGFLSPWDFETKKRVRRCLKRCEIMLRAWAVGLFCGMLCMFFLTWFGLSIIKMQGAFLFATVAGFLNIIPTLGPFLAAFTPLCISLATKPLHYAFYVLLIYIIMHQIESHVMTPLIMKKQLSVHPMILILAILVMVTFFGMIGAFIAAPVCAVIGICYDEFVLAPRKKKNL